MKTRKTRGTNFQKIFSLRKTKQGRFGHGGGGVHKSIGDPKRIAQARKLKLDDGYINYGP